MGPSGGWSKPKSVSALFLLSCTVVAMVVLFLMETYVFQPSCATCGSSGDAEQDRLGRLWNRVLDQRENFSISPSVAEMWALVEERDKLGDLQSAGKLDEFESSNITKLDKDMEAQDPNSVDLVLERVEPTDKLEDFFSDGNLDEIDLSNVTKPIEEVEGQDFSDVGQFSRIETLDSSEDEPVESERSPEPKDDKMISVTDENAEDVVDDLSTVAVELQIETNEEGELIKPEIQELEDLEDKSTGSSVLLPANEKETKPIVSNGRASSEQVDTDGIVGSPPPNFANRVWYYTNVHKFAEAKLRLLTADDGAPAIYSSTRPGEREITIVTQTSPDRLQALETTCLTWGGAMCIAVHVRLESEIALVHMSLQQMHNRMEEMGGCRLDIQVVTEDGFETDEAALQALYPVNALRNVALSMATTKLVFLLDADFKPSPGLHEYLTEDGLYEELVKNATQLRQLFVVPAFEVLSPGPKRRIRNISVPQTMEELRARWKKGEIDCFHCAKSPTGHVPTNFTKFFDPNTSATYSISYEDGFEPYVIAAAAEIPMYDARFRGYGENKVSHLYSCHAHGMTFRVLPHSFVVEIPHPPSSAHDTYIGKRKDPEQRYQIVGLYRQFKAELAKLRSNKDTLRSLKSEKSDKTVEMSARI